MASSRARDRATAVVGWAVGGMGWGVVVRAMVTAAVVAGWWAGQWAEGLAWSSVLWLVCLSVDLSVGWLRWLSEHLLACKGVIDSSQ